MAMLRLLARDSNALAVMPEVVVKDEIAAGKLTSYMTLPNIHEHFYAVTVKKHLPNPWVAELITNYINTGKTKQLAVGFVHNLGDKRQNH